MSLGKLLGIKLFITRVGWFREAEGWAQKLKEAEGRQKGEEN